ncbi:histone-lysine N-methyltransferase ash1-like [Daphnia carinata]|uniref:histone-lysine N-methyltransferase ash1-like n=1 Tax=Daphnia carinata TaxID=120202 RepID=UPI00257C5F0D|nr:histone-lysine N-methyltransferase ash1-like [Daphnia carinata]
MANLNALPDLSTVDIQAIQDSGPVHPRISLPPLTTIAENWDSVEPSSRNLILNDESCSEDDEESDEEDQSHGSTSGKIQERNSHRTSCSSSSSVPDSGTESSESELSDATSDSAGSSSSSSDSDSDSQSSASSASNKSKVQQSTVRRDKTSFSVREANYDKGRVTLRLSTLQLGRKKEITNMPVGKTTKIPKLENARTMTASSFEACDTDNVCMNANNQSVGTSNKTDKLKGVNNQKATTPVKRTRQLRAKSRSEPLNMDSSKPGRGSLPKSLPSVTVTKTLDKARKKAIETPVFKKGDCLPSVMDVYSTVITKKDNTHANTSLTRSTVIPPSSHPVAGFVNIGPSMSDLDSDSDELYLPAVSEAIRMLDLDSQGSPANNIATGLSNSALRISSHPPLPSNTSSASSVSAWPSVGYCSSLLQQFVAKSQSGEPPPPPPTLMLPTKGARKCFPPNDEPLPSSFMTTADSKSIKRTIEVSKPSSFSAIHNATLLAPVTVSHMDQDLDVMVPMRGLDCHQSHVSPDSGIQSVSGSPFSVHSSPVHPSGIGNNNQTGGQLQSLVVSPCPPITSPSPPLHQKPTNRKSSSNQKNSTTKYQDVPLQMTNVRSSDRQSESRSRRPRSCRDTASALSSGLGKDSSIAQAIQRGMNAALRLKNKNTAGEVTNSPNGAAVTYVQTTLAKSKGSRTKKSKKKHLKNDHSQVKCSLKVPIQDSSTFCNEITTQVSSLVTRDSGDSETSPVMMLHQPKLTNELKATITRSPSPQLHNKRRKKKRKKHKNSGHDKVLTVPVDPSLQSTLDQLCRRLDSCTISKSVADNGPVNNEKRPWIFQCRKYTFTTGNCTSGNSRTKRKKPVEDTVNHSNVKNSVGKRKGKPKRTALQSVPVLASCNVEATREEEPCIASAAASSALSAVELLLPLKKRHHHLATSTETPVAKSASINVHDCESAIEKPSHDQVLSKLIQQQQVSSRKRVALGESTTIETNESMGDDQDECKPQIASNPKPRKGRGSKKAKLEITEEAIISITAAPEMPVNHVQTETQLNLSATPTPPVQGEEESQLDKMAKKRHRRRKTFNRTGFPTVKKKRKKLPSPVPSLAVPQPSSSKDEIEQSALCNPSSRQAKRAKLMPSKEEDDDGLLPEPTSSEAPSGDESNPMLPLLSIKGSLPKKRRMSNVRKRYLPAGLLSNYFKEDPENNSGTIAVSTDRTKFLTYEPEEHEHGLLPPPFYCERILRRTKRDFQLPFDVWWLHQQGKLPDRDNLVPSWNYRKIRSNVYYDVKPPFTNDAEACNCTLPQPDAEDAEAQCCGDDCLNRMVYTECNSQMCPVGDKCMNQRIQRHRWAQGLERFMTKEKGWGVRCRNELKSGVFILEYVGEVVSDKEFKERMHTVYVHDTHHYCLHLDGGLVIDGHRMGGDGRFVNHSCAPNCEMQKWSVNGLPRMALFALRDISPLEELSYDYNFSLFNPAEGQPCKCGSPQCRGVIGGKSQRVNTVQDVTGSKLPQKLSLQKRKRKTQVQGKTHLTICSSSINLRPLSAQQRVFVLQHRCFLLRNLDKVRDWRDRQKDRIKQAKQQNQIVGRSRRFISRPNVDQEKEFALSATEKDPLPHENITVDTEKPPEPTPDLQMLKMEENHSNVEEVVHCRCRLFDDEGLMVQCEKCETWQHSDCLGSGKESAVNAEHYVCHACAGLSLCPDDLKIVLVPQPENPPEGQIYYLSLYYKDLHLRQGDCVYVLRDHDTPDSERALWNGVGEEFPQPRPPQRLPPHIKLANLDIFQIERMWADENGKQFVWGHHFYRPQDTYHEPSRKFFVNELCHSPLEEAIPIWAVVGRCWVLDLTTFCKGRPVDAVEEHVYICEYRVDRTASLFTKNRAKFSVCTRRFAFKRFVTRLKPQRTYQPHGAPPSSSRKATESVTAKSTPKNEKHGKEKLKKRKQENSSLPQSTSSVAEAQLKIDEQKSRLDKLLRHLLIKKAPEGSLAEDATHLLHRGRGRMRGRPPKRKGVSSTT